MAAEKGGGSRRARPNVLMTGTPGTGKTTTCSLLAESAGLRHVNIGDLVREKGLHDGWDEDLQCHIINEDLNWGMSFYGLVDGNVEEEETRHHCHQFALSSGPTSYLCNNHHSELDSFFYLRCLSIA